MTTTGKLTIPSMKERCSAAEWTARVDLAACYRLVDLYGMSDMMANHVSSHVPGAPRPLARRRALRHEPT